MSLQLSRSLRRYFRRPSVVLHLALLAALLSAAIIVLLAVGSAQVLLGGGSEALPLVYLLLSAASLPLASAISAALRRWPVVQIGESVAVASVLLAIALRLAVLRRSFRRFRPQSASSPICSRSSSTRCSG